MKLFKRTLFFAISLFCSKISFAMDYPKMHQKQMVHFCLMDDKKCYNLDLSKVEKSRFLLAAYHADRKKFPYQACKVHVTGISKEEMKLFDESLDTDIDPKSEKSFKSYFQKKISPEQRRLLTIVASEYDESGMEKLDVPFLRAQLADEWINHESDLGCKHIAPCFSHLITYCKFAMIKESLEQKTAQSCDPYTYYSEDMLYKNPPQVDMKIREGGGCLYLPSVEGLDGESFDGRGLFPRLNTQGGMRIKWIQTCKDSEIGYFIMSKGTNSSSKDMHSKLNIFKSTPSEGLCYVKEIDHSGYDLEAAWLSPDKKLVVTTSTGNQGLPALLLLTSLDDSKPEEFLGDIKYECLNGTIDFCFNHTSDILACVQSEAIHFFDIKSQKIISSLPFEYSLSPTIKTQISFNRDSSRLVFGLLIRNTYCMDVYDTSDLKSIKKINSFCESNVYNSSNPLVTSNPQIRFSYINKQASASSDSDDGLSDLIVVSGSNITLFFDAHSGQFLSKKKSTKPFLSLFSKKLDIDHAATVSIPDSPATFIGIDHGNSSAISLYDHITGEEIGTIAYAEPNLYALGLTKNLASLIAIFKNNKTIKTDFFDDQKFQAILNSLRFVDWYILFQLYFAKKSKVQHNIPQSLVDYITMIFNSGNMNNFIEEHFLSNEKNSWADYFGFFN